MCTSPHCRVFHRRIECTLQHQKVYAVACRLRKRSVGSRAVVASMGVQSFCLGPQSRKRPVHGGTCTQNVCWHGLCQSSVGGGCGGINDHAWYICKWPKQERWLHMHRACFKDNEALVDVLLTNEADATVPNHRGSSSIDLARKVHSLPSIQNKLKASTCASTA